MPDDHSSVETLSEPSAEHLTPREKMLQGFDRLVSKGYATKPDDDFTGYPVEVVHGEAVPIRGNVHIGLGRAISRAKINKEFAR